MSVWRPRQSIGVKVIGLAWRGDTLLAAEVLSDAGRVKGARPLGGSIDLGETREQALTREFREELGCAVEICGPWLALENLFEHEGCLGHEFIFAANVRLLDESLYLKEEIHFFESDGSACVARWFSPLAMPHGVELYPVALALQIEAGGLMPTGRFPGVRS